MTFDPAPPTSARVPPGGADPQLRPLPGGTRPDHVTALLDALQAGLSAELAPSVTNEHDGGTAPRPHGGTIPQPDGGATPQPDGGATPQPDGGTIPQPDGGTAPQPHGAARPNPPVLVPHDPESDGVAIAAAVARRLRRDVPAQTAVILQTSGSTTGTGHLVALTAGSLVASARATEERLAGPGQWLLAVPAHHVAGLQVLVRSVVAGTTPAVLDTSAGFDPRELAAAVEGMRTDVPGYLSLVPTQLVRALDAGEGAVAPLRGLAAILVGGAATAPRALERARDQGLRVVTTYGMTETGGGCVYDGRPLPGVRLRLTGDDRVEITGPVLAAGYLDDPVADADAFRTEGGVRWLRTSDRAAIAGAAIVASPESAPQDGRTGARELGGDDAGLRLRVLGRVDDLINTGGIKVSPGTVERILAAHPAVAEVAVVGVPDAEWGELVTAVVVAAPGRDTPPLAELRRLVSAGLDGAHAPRALVEMTALPLRGPGKIDRRAAAQHAARALAAAEGRAAAPVPKATEAPQATEAPKAPGSPGETGGASRGATAGSQGETGGPSGSAVVRAERYGRTTPIS